MANFRDIFMRLLLIVIGVSMVIYGLGLPYHEMNARVTAIENGRPTTAVEAEYVQKYVDALRTKKECETIVKRLAQKMERRQILAERNSMELLDFINKGSWTTAQAAAAQYRNESQDMFAETKDDLSLLANYLKEY